MSVLPLAAQSIERVEQRRVVARMQADRRFVEHVAHSLQIRTELRGETNALCLAARQRGRGAIELQVAEAHVAEECGARRQLREQVARDLEFAARQA